MTPEQDDLAIATGQMLRRVPQDERGTLLASILADFARNLKRIWGARMSPIELRRRVRTHRAAIEAVLGE